MPVIEDPLCLRWGQKLKVFPHKILKSWHYRIRPESNHTLLSNRKRDTFFCQIMTVITCWWRRQQHTLWWREGLSGPKSKQHLQAVIMIMQFGSQWCSCCVLALIVHPLHVFSEKLHTNFSWCFSSLYGLIQSSLPVNHQLVVASPTEKFSFHCDTLILV